MEKMMSTQGLVTSQQGVADYLKNVYTLESNLYSLKREEGRLKWDI